MADRMDWADVLVLAGKALGRIDAWGHRGATSFSRDEVEAMALLLAALGLPSIPPGAATAVVAAKAGALQDFFNTHFNGGSDEQ